MFPRLKLSIFISFLLIIANFVKSDWVEIQQVKSDPNPQSSSVRLPFQNSDVLSSILKKNSSIPLKVIEPNVEWIEYQNDWFSSAGNNTRNRVVISNIKNSSNNVKVLRISPNENENIKNPTEIDKEILNGENSDSSDEDEDDDDDESSDEELNPEVVDFKIPDKIHNTKNTSFNDEKSNLHSKLLQEPHDGMKIGENSSTSQHSEESSKYDKPNKIDSQEYNTESLSGRAIGRKGIIANAIKEKHKLLSFEGFMQFLKTIQNSLVLNTSSSIKQKINSLVKFRDKLLINIEDRLKDLWPKTAKRQRRGLFGENAVEIPSAEAALMTINFLTFAVFLIKLVLQVINTIKSKHYSFNGFNVNTMEAIKVARNKRNAVHLDDSQSDVEKINNILRTFVNFKDKNFLK